MRSHDNSVRSHGKCSGRMAIRWGYMATCSGCMAIRCGYMAIRCVFFEKNGVLCEVLKVVSPLILEQKANLRCTVVFRSENTVDNKDVWISLNLNI